MTIHHARGDVSFERWCRERIAYPPYVLFELEPGCGADAVQKVFYELVKLYHPDALGPFADDREANLARELFLRVKATHEQLLEKEKKLAKSSPTQPAAASVNETKKHAKSKPKRLDDKTKRREAMTRLKARKTRNTLDALPAIIRKPDTSTVAPEERQNAFDRLKTRHSQPRVEPLPASMASANGSETTTAQADVLREPTSMDPKDQFAYGYQLFRAEHYAKSLEPFKRAYEAEPEHGLYTTFYGHVLFLCHPEERDKAEKLLRDAVLAKHKQSLPDAHLFLGFLLKTKPGGEAEAIRHFRNVVHLNPSSHEAQREIRLYEHRQNAPKEPETTPFFKKLFKK